MQLLFRKVIRHRATARSSAKTADRGIENANDHEVLGC